ncbi:MAG: DUF5110 domain-containing protein [Deltaproteobacteria bacterium]|jgi:alpha-glucosidase|nr:DUF5110 domain-containing protein [Deltaproteobacteria bacterium]
MERGIAGKIFSAVLFLLPALVVLTAAAVLPGPASAAPPSTSRFGPYYLTQQRLGNGLWRFRLGLDEPDPESPWVATPMLSDTGEWAGPHPGPESRLVVSGADTPTPTLTIIETLPDGSQSTAFSVSPAAPDGQLAGLAFHGERYSHVVGLGADFRFSLFNINHQGEIVMPGGPFGNILEKSPGVRASGLQSPVCIALGPGFQNAALFINETRPLAWDFTSSPWYVGPTGPLGPSESVDFFVLLGPDLPSLRRTLMAMLGRQALPPKSVFAPWILAGDAPSAAARAEVLSSLAQQKNGFETLTVMFEPQPENPPHALAASLGLNILVTESPYLPTDSPHYVDMTKRGFLVRANGPQASPLLLSYHNRLSSLIDYTNSPAADYWHSLVRAGQVEAGASLFYLVGGEPEVYSPAAWYQGSGPDDLHSHYAWGPRFALKWMESLGASVMRPVFSRSSPPRLFAVSRAGLGGMGRFGAGVLAIDPNPFFPRNAGQARANLILSGVDYYSTDVSALTSQFPMDSASRLYEAWLANVALLNLPLVLPGEMLAQPWARVNLDLKASLEPYYYSLAWKSSRTGEPLIAPLVYYFQDDPLARESAFETMVGPSLLVPAGVAANDETLSFHLPEGRWYNPHTREIIDQLDGSPRSLPVKIQGLHMPPILFKSGSVVPMISDPAGPTRRKTILAFPGESPASFDWYEDNGLDQSHLSGVYSVTSLDLSARAAGPSSPPVALTIRARVGSVPGEETAREFLVEFVDVGNVGAALLDGDIHRRLNSESQLLAMDSGWFSLGTGRLLFKTPPLDPSVDHQIVLNPS